MNNKIILSVIFAIILLLAGYNILISNKDDHQKKVKVSDIKEDTIIHRESTILEDPANRNVFIYTSYKLGIQFSYVKNEGYGLAPLKPIEIGNRISFDNDNYIMVFQQLPGESIEKTLRRVIPDQFDNNNCTVLPFPEQASPNYIVWDKRIPLTEYGSDMAPGIESNIVNACNPTMWLEFRSNILFPGVIYYLHYSTQVPSFWADVEHTKQWWQTVHLISQ